MSAATGTAGSDEDVVVHEVVRPPVSLRTRIVSGVVLVVVGLACAFVLGLSARAGRDATFGLAVPGAAVAVPDLTLPARATAVALGLVVTTMGVWQIARGFRRRASPWVVALTVVAVVVAFLSWASTGASASRIDLVGLLQNTVATAVPLVLGALAGVLCERSGVINVAIEGQMLAGAWAGALVGTLASSLGAGVVAAMVAGGLMGLLLAVFSIRYLVNQVVLGVVLNVLALGITGYVYDALMQANQDSLNNPAVFAPIAIPLLSDIPVLGPLLFDANLIVYLTYLLVVVIDVALVRTRWGLRTRAVGEHPKAAATVGINVFAVRYRNVVAGGAVAGLAGAYLTIGAVGAFSKNMTSGKGFIALAAVIFGGWQPRAAVGAALLFGFTDALGTLLSFTPTPVSIPSNLLAMLPYLATLFAVAGLVGRVRAPAADGEPYVKG